MFCFSSSPHFTPYKSHKLKCFYFFLPVNYHFRLINTYFIASITWICNESKFLLLFKYDKDLTTRRAANLHCHWILCQQAKSQNILIITRGSVHASVWLEHWRWSVLEKLDGANQKGSFSLKSKIKTFAFVFLSGPKFAPLNTKWHEKNTIFTRTYTNGYEFKSNVYELRLS